MNCSKSPRNQIGRRGALRISAADHVREWRAPARPPARRTEGRAAGTDAPKIGRPVRAVSLSFRDKPLQTIVDRVDREGARGADLVVLPETWRGQKGDTAETLDGPTVTAMGALAARHSMHIVCPIDRKDGTRRLNTAVWLDRQGRVACTYDKVYPYWAEFDLEPPVQAGHDVPVVQTDLGRIGMAICFDVNFPEVWQQLADQGAELVVWPSAYSAGTSLMAHAINHHYYILTSTLLGDCLVFDITGRVIHDQRDKDINVSRVTLDLDRGIYHQNFNMGPRDRLLREHGDDVEQEEWLDREQWFVLRAKRPGVSARELARRYGLEELRDYVSRSRRQIDAASGPEGSRGGATGGGPRAMRRDRRDRLIRMVRLTGSRLVVIGVLVASVQAGEGQGEWLQFRHDRALTGRTSLTGHIRKPVVTWKRFLGARESLLAVRFTRQGDANLALPAADEHVESWGTLRERWGADACAEGPRR